MNIEERLREKSNTLIDCWLATDYDNTDMEIIKLTDALEITGVDDAKKWQIEKPNKPCLFLHRYDNKDKFPSLHHAIYDGDELVVRDTEYNFSDTMENFADGEFFIIEQLKEK